MKKSNQLNGTIQDGDGKQIIVAGYENFGPGSFDFLNRFHKFVLAGGSIITCKVTITSQDIVSLTNPKIIRTDRSRTEYYNGMQIITCDN